MKKTTVVNLNTSINNVFFPGDVVEVINTNKLHFNCTVGHRYKVIQLKIKPNLDNGSRVIGYIINKEKEEFLFQENIILFKRPLKNWLKYWWVKLKGKQTLIEVAKKPKEILEIPRTTVEHELFILDQNPHATELTELEFSEIMDKINSQKNINWVGYSQRLDYLDKEFYIKWPNLYDYLCQKGYVAQTKFNRLKILYYQQNNKIHKEVYIVTPIIKP